jgi:hypothetical protein
MLMGAEARQFGRGKVSVALRNTEDREWRTMSRDGVREGIVVSEDEDEEE